jgi:hypothetical protein
MHSANCPTRQQQVRFASSGPRIGLAHHQPEPRASQDNPPLSIERSSRGRVDALMAGCLAIIKEGGWPSQATGQTTYAVHVKMPSGRRKKDCATESAVT